jgi:hypothetical protein
MKTIVMNHPGGAEVLELVDRPDPVPHPGQALVEVRRCGTFCWYGPVLGASGALHIMSLPRSIKIGYAMFFCRISSLRTGRWMTWTRRDHRNGELTGQLRGSRWVMATGGLVGEADVQTSAVRLGTMSVDGRKSSRALGSALFAHRLVRIGESTKRFTAPVPR